MTTSDARNLQILDDVIWNGNIKDKGSVQRLSLTHVFIRWENKDRRSGWYRFCDLGGIFKVPPEEPIVRQ